MPLYTTRDDIFTAVNSQVSPDTEYLITTRIDNDDAVSQDFVEAVQSRFGRQRFGFVNLTRGYVHALRTHPVLALLRVVGLADSPTTIRTHQGSNPFISLIEKRNDDGFRTVLMDTHWRLGEYGPIEQVTDEYYWIQVVHDRNVVNQHNLRPHRLALNALYRTREGTPISFARFKLGARPEASGASSR